MFSMKTITNIYNTFTHANKFNKIFILTFFTILVSLILVIFIMLIIDSIFSLESFGYYGIGALLSIIIPSITTPIISYNIIIFTAKLEKAGKHISTPVQYDNLTKIYNRRHTLELANYEFALSKRLSIPISAIFIQYKDLKNINKTYGEEIGDILLVELSRSISYSIRNTDIFGRYDKDKFLLIFPNLELSIVQKLIEKIRNAAEQVIHINDTGIKINISIAFSEINNYQDATLQTLLDKAQRQL
ncbi:MAG: diguanylate cyclase (GGDEF)-like protein [Sulfurimonas sp.]|jgi:diguanylate cyclase (GGDEF)-like protein